ncbi:MAG: 5-formyltetrahydrofolate cyclo-ligase [Chthoniobacterales bacterium]
MRARIAALTVEQRQIASLQILEKLTSLKEWHSARAIALFHPLAFEPDCVPLDLSAKAYCFPRVEGKELHFHFISNREHLKKGAFGILEPDAEKHLLAKLEDVGIVVVPGAAFDEQGNRLGKGQGFYDRVLSTTLKNAFKVGVCFACQITESIPQEPHDVRMNRVLFA